MSAQRGGKKRNDGHSAVQVADLVVGEGAPYDVCDAYGTLLLRKGSRVQSERQKEQLHLTGWAIVPPSPDDTSGEPIFVPLSVAQQGTQGKSGPFEAFRTCADALNDLFSLLQSERPGAAQRLERVISQLGHLAAVHPDAAIGISLVERELPERVARPIRRAIGAAVLAEVVGLPLTRREPLMGAALTADTGMLTLQETLDQQPEPISSEQRKLLFSHPRHSVDLLRREGLGDPVWLRTVDQHHERLDGSGYPAGLSDQQISREARILMIADTYMAMIAPRAHRRAKTATQAVRELKADAGIRLDWKLTLALLNGVGVFPPGTPIRLKDGRLVIVARRGVEARTPVVTTLKDPDGNPVEAPTEYSLGDDQVAADTVLPPDELEDPVDPRQIWPTG